MVQWPPTSNAPRSEQYALRAGGLAAAGDELEHRTRLAIEVVLLWRGDLLTVSHLSPPGTFFIGGSRSLADVSLPPEWLGSERLCVAIASRSEISAVLPAHARCWSMLPDGSTRHFQPGSGPVQTSDASPSTERVLPLDLGHRAHMCLGEIEIQVAAVPAGRAPARRRSIGFDTATLAYFGLSSLSIAGVLTVLSVLAPPAGLTPDEETASERLYLLQRYLAASAERELEIEIERKQNNGDAPAASARVSDALRHSSSPLRVEVPPTGAELEDAPSLDTPLENDEPASDPRARRAQLEKARSFGVLALMGANFAALSDPKLRFRRTLSSAELADMQHLFNPDSDPRFGADGPGGLALSGIGLGGGGKADVIALEAVGTIGDGEGKGFLRAAQFGSPAGSYRPSVPQLRARAGAASDALAPAAVLRTVHAEAPRFRSCYEHGLAAHPTLAGTTVVRFVVEPDGHVDQVSTNGTDLPADVRACIAAVFQGLTFPSPGAAVNATYPVRLTP